MKYCYFDGKGTPDHGFCECQFCCKRKIKNLELELAAANKGARINAMINTSLTKQLIELKERVAAMPNR